MKNNLKKNFIWNLIGSTINSFTSLFFLIIVTRINGVNEAGTFTFAFANACFLQVIGIYATRAFQVTENNKKITDNDYVNTKIITTILMVLIAAIFSFIKGYNNEKIFIIILLAIYKALDAFSESIYAIIQKNDKLYQVGISLFFKGIIGTIVFLLVNLLTKNIIFSTIILIVSNILIILLYDLEKVKICNYKFIKINLNNCLSILKISFWTFLFSFLTQYLINAPKYAIDNNLNSDMQTIYGIISMPATIMILISNFIIHPFLLKITNNIIKKEFNKLNKLLIKMLLSIIVIGITSIVLAYFIGIPVLNILYNINLDNYKTELLIIILGATIFSLTMIISNVLIALRKTKSQGVIFIITSVATFIFSNILVKQLYVLGASYSYLISMSILLVLYLIIYIYIIVKEMQNEK